MKNNKPNKPYMNKKVTIAERLTLWKGTLRRLSMHLFNKKQLRKGIASRQGECIRCGMCCRLTFNCMWLTFDSEGQSTCRKYNAIRPVNCHHFPIDRRDIRDRNIISDCKCGYYFDE
ncbi:MAG: hypothetical protein LBV41_12670 [Cytophagaceae bacterium]|jgi:hypothetical protein|nr:hypothetical protein [Cytophagaceae bacterium]